MQMPVCPTHHLHIKKCCVASRCPDFSLKSADHHVTGDPAHVRIKIENGSTLQVSDLASGSFDDIPQEEQQRMMSAFSWRLRMAPGGPRLMSEEQVGLAVTACAVCGANSHQRA